MMLLSTDQEEEAAAAARDAATTAAPSLSTTNRSRWSAATTVAAAPQWSLNSSDSNTRRRPHPETPQMLTLGRFERSTDEYEINHQQSYYQHQQPHSPPPTHRQRMIDNNTHRTRNVPDNVTDDDTDIMMRRHANASLVESEDGAVAILHNHNNGPESSWWQRPSLFWNARSSTQHKETLMESATESASTTTTEHVFHLAKNADTPYNHSRPKSPRRTSARSQLWPTQMHSAAAADSTSDMNERESSYRVLDDNNQTASTKTASKPSNGEPANNMDCSFFFRESDQDEEETRNSTTTYRSFLGSGSGNGSGSGMPHNFSPVAMRRNYRHSQLYEYQDAVPVMARPVLAQFQARYTQLNQELVYPKHSRHRHVRTTTTSSSSPVRHHPTMDTLAQFWPHNDNNNDIEADPWDDMATLQSLRLQTLLESSLHLSSSETNGSKDDDDDDNNNNQNDATGLEQAYHPAPHGHDVIGNVVGNAAERRTEWAAYQISDASRRKVPRDQVRLLMDPDLEVGILSVEQWRCKETVDEPGSSRQGCETGRNHHAPSSFQTEPTAGSSSSSSPPPLRYVLTVSDDLYRSVVAEMSPTTTKYFCCPRACCNEDERADIRVAVYLLLVILVILFINTMAFHEH
jgi:hypothetical protein